MAVSSIEQGSAAGCERDLWILVGFLTIKLNVAVDYRVLPDGLPRAVTLPCFHCLAVRPRTVRDPGQKLNHQQVR